jgi:hypothetical protein
MRRLALMTAGLMAVLSIAPSVLPLEATVVGLMGFVGYLIWKIWPKR